MTGQGGRIEHEETYPHPPERLWRAITEPAELGAWLMPTDFTARAGSRFTFDARPEFGIIDGEVLEIEPPGCCAAGGRAFSGTPSSPSH